MTQMLTNGTHQTHEATPNITEAQAKTLFQSLLDQEGTRAERAPIDIDNFGKMRPKNNIELARMARLLWKSGWCPSSYKNEDQVIVAGAMGMEIGLTLFQAVRSIAVINGRPSLWGDAMLALVRSSPKCKSVKEWFENLNPDGSVGEKTVACCRALREGEAEPIETRFYYNDAKTAGSLGKDTYKQHGKRMLQMRARGFCLRDAFPDLLNGIITTEEAMDSPEEPRDTAADLNKKVDALASSGVNGTAGAGRDVVIPGATAPAPSVPAETKQETPKQAPAPQPTPTNVGTVDRPRKPRGSQHSAGDLLAGTTDQPTITPDDLEFGDETGGA